MEESVSLEHRFDLAEILFGVIKRCPGQQNTCIVVVEVFLDRLADRDDVGLEVAARPEVNLAAIRFLYRVNLCATMAVESWRHVNKA